MNATRRLERLETAIRQSESFRAADLLRRVRALDLAARDEWFDNHASPENVRLIDLALDDLERKANKPLWAELSDAELVLSLGESCARLMADGCTVEMCIAHCKQAVPPIFERVSWESIAAAAKEFQELTGMGKSWAEAREIILETTR